MFIDRNSCDFIIGSVAQFVVFLRNGRTPSVTDITFFWPIEFSAKSNAFYALRLYRTAVARISYGDVCLSVRLSRPGGVPSPGEIETPGLQHMIA